MSEEAQEQAHQAITEIGKAVDKSIASAYRKGIALAAQISDPTLRQQAAEAHKRTADRHRRLLEQLRQRSSRAIERSLDTPQRER